MGLEDSNYKPSSRLSLWSAEVTGMRHHPLMQEILTKYRTLWALGHLTTRGLKAQRKQTGLKSDCTESAAKDEWTHGVTPDYLSSRTCTQNTQWHPLYRSLQLSLQNMTVSKSIFWRLDQGVAWFLVKLFSDLWTGRSCTADKHSTNWVTSSACFVSYCFTLQPWLARNSLCRSGWSRTYSHAPASVSLLLSSWPVPRV